MEIILLERVDKLGQMGDLVTVKSGYARNFLLPQGKAVFASQDNIKYFEEQKAQLEGENIAKRTEAKSLADSISFKEVVLIRAASEAGQLYGSVSAKDIANEITNSGLTISKNQVVLNKAIKSLSYEDIIVKLHPEISIKIKLNIARSSEEAKEQNKSGKALVSTETIGGDIRSERAQKDAKRFIKKEEVNTKSIDDRISKNVEKINKLKEKRPVPTNDVARLVGLNNALRDKKKKLQKKNSDRIIKCTIFYLL